MARDVKKLRLTIKRSPCLYCIYFKIQLYVVRTKKNILKTA
jgi:hypothetical protein